MFPFYQLRSNKITCKVKEIYYFLKYLKNENEIMKC